MEKTIIITLLGLLIFGCRNIEEEVTKKIAETTVETLTGNEVEIDNLNNQNKTSNTVSVMYDGQAILDDADHLSATVIIVNNAMITLSLRGEEEQILMGFTVESGKENLFNNHPIQGDALFEEKAGIQVSFTYNSENRQGISFVRGQSSIATLSDEKIIINLKGKATELLNVSKEETFKDIEATLTLNHPIITYTNTDKSKFTY